MQQCVRLIQAWLLHDFYHGINRYSKQLCFSYYWRWALVDIGIGKTMQPISRIGKSTYSSWNFSIKNVTTFKHASSRSPLSDRSQPEFQTYFSCLFSPSQTWQTSTHGSSRHARVCARVLCVCVRERAGECQHDYVHLRFISTSVVDFNWGS